MNIRLVFGALIVGAATAIAAPSSLSLAQSTDQGATAPRSAKPNTNVTPRKHRYWRHQGDGIHISAAGGFAPMRLQGGRRLIEPLGYCLVRRAQPVLVT